MSKRATSKRSLTDWNRVDRLTDAEIDFSDLPEIPPEMFARAIVRKGLKPDPRKQQITLRVDSDVVEWFRRAGSGYQTKISAVLKAYKEAHRASTVRSRASGNLTKR